MAAGGGIGTVHAARGQPGYPGVAYARLVEPELTIETGVVWRRGDEAPLLDRFVETIAGERACGRRVGAPP